MRNLYGRCIAFIMVLALVFTSLPVNANAATWTKASRFNPELVKELDALCAGKDFTADDVLTELYNKGIIDREGNILLSNTFLVQEAGQEPQTLTNEELRALAFDTENPKDPEVEVLIDNQLMTWGEVHDLFVTVDALELIHRCMENAENGETLTEDHLTSIGSFYQALSDGTVKVNWKEAAPENSSNKIYFCVSGVEGAEEYQFCTIKGTENGQILTPYENTGNASFSQSAYMKLMNLEYLKAYSSSEFGEKLIAVKTQDALCLSSEDADKSFYCVKLTLNTSDFSKQLESMDTSERNTYEAIYEVDSIPASELPADDGEEETESSLNPLPVISDVDIIEMKDVGPRKWNGVGLDKVYLPTDQFIKQDEIANDPHKLIPVYVYYYYWISDLDFIMDGMHFESCSIKLHDTTGKKADKPVMKQGDYYYNYHDNPMRMKGGVDPYQNADKPILVEAGDFEGYDTIVLDFASYYDPEDYRPEYVVSNSVYLGKVQGTTVIPDYKTAGTGGFIPLKDVKPKLPDNTYDVDRLPYSKLESATSSTLKQAVIDFIHDNGCIVVSSGQGTETYTIKDIKADTGVFFSGQKIRFTLTMDQYIMGDIKLTVNGEELSPVSDPGEDRYSKQAVFEYTVKADDAAYPIIQKATITSNDAFGLGFYKWYSVQPDNEKWPGVVLGAGEGSGLHVKSSTVNGVEEKITFLSPRKDQILEQEPELVEDPVNGQYIMMKFPVGELSSENTPEASVIRSNVRWICNDTKLEDGQNGYLRSIYATLGSDNTKLPVKVKMVPGTFTYVSPSSGQNVNVSQVPEYLYVELPKNDIDAYKLTNVHFYVKQSFDSEDYYKNSVRLNEITAYNPEHNHWVWLPPVTVATEENVDICYNEGWLELAEAYPVLRAEQGDKFTINCVPLDAAIAKPLQLTYAIDKQNEYTFMDPSDFEWESSNTSVAEVTIAEEDYTWNGQAKKRLVANIAVKDCGTVYFTLRVKNGNPLNEFTLKSSKLTISDATEPFMSIPAKSAIVYTNVGMDASVVFSTNIARRNSELYQQDTTYTVNVYEADETGNKLADKLVYTGTAKASYDNPVYSIKIPGLKLQKTSPEGGVSYVAEVSGQCFATKEAYLEYLASGSAENGPITYTAEAKINVKEGPITIVVDSNVKDATTNDAPYTFSWTWRGVSQNSDNKKWYYEVVNMEDGTIVKKSEPTSDFTAHSITLAADDLVIANAATTLKNVYSISVYATNDVTRGYSVQSMLLSVYNADAIDIWVRDVKKKNDNAKTVTEVADRSYELNHEYFVKDSISADGKTLDLEAYEFSIEQLRKDVALAAVVSVKYGDYTWGLVSDQIAWEAKDPVGSKDAANLYLEKGGLYSDIENFANPTYLPIDEFLLAGEHNGSVIIKATHARSGISKEVTVKVQDIKNQLYLFQFYPLAETTVTYVDNKDHQPHTVISDSKGQLALYEEAGIDPNSKLYFKSNYKGADYLGMLSGDKLRTGEANVVKAGGSYALNAINLQAVGQADIYLIKPDGTPLANTDVTLRGGAYLDHAYVATADLYDTAGQTDDANGDTEVSNGLSAITRRTDSNGKISVYFNMGQFNDGNGIYASDKVSYAFELTFSGDQYRPEIFEMEAAGTEKSSKYINRVINLQAAANKKGVDFYTKTALAYTDNNGRTIGGAYLKETERFVGANEDFDANLSPRVVLWSEKKLVNHAEGAISTFAEAAKVDGMDVCALEYYQNNTKMGNQVSRMGIYEFSTIPFVDGGLYVDEDLYKEIGLASGQSRKISLQLNKYGASTATFSPSYELINSQGVSAKSPEVKQRAKEAAESVGEEISIEKLIADKIPGGDMLFQAFEFIGGVKGDTAPVAIMLIPTTDPTTFDVVLEIGEVAEAFADGEDEDEEGLSLDFSESFDTSELEKALSGEDDDDDEDGSGEFSADFTVWGTMVGRVSYNTSNRRWTMDLIEGTIGADLQLSYKYEQSIMLGAVPAFFEIGIHGGLGAQMENYFLNEYVSMTTVQLSLGVDAFAGIGFDYSVIALKLGITGSIGGVVTLKMLMGNKTPFRHGEQLTLDGQIGLKFEAKILFVSYEKTLVSTGFSKSWQWNQYSELEAWEAPTKSGRMYSAYFEDGELKLELLTASMFALYSMLDVDIPATGDLLAPGDIIKLTGDESPVLSEDGQILVYQYQGVPCWAKLESGTKYIVQGAIAGEAAQTGAFYLDVSGTNGNYVAVWSQQTDEREKEGSDALEVSNDDLAIGMNSTEIYAAVYNGVSWDVEQLTDNLQADISPKVSVSGDKAIVTWRNTYGSDASKPLVFDVENNIKYKMYDSSIWSTEAVAYNGTAGSPMALDVALTATGAAVIAYSVSTTPDAKEATNGIETFYTYINGADSRTVRATTNQNLDENVKVAVIKEGETQEVVLAWHSQKHESAEKDSDLIDDIQLLAVREDGTIDSSFPESLSKMSNLDVTPNFVLSSVPTEGVEKLVLVWTHRNTDEDAKENTVIYGSKFWKNAEGELGVTPRQVLAKTSDYCAVDSFAAYTADDGFKVFLAETDYSEAMTKEVDSIDIEELLSHIVKKEDFGTNDAAYRAEKARVRNLLTDGDSNTLKILAAEGNAKLELKTCSFTDNLSLKAKLSKDVTVIPGLKVPVDITVKNLGFTPRYNLSVKTGAEDFVTIEKLLPGETVQVTELYDVPETAVNTEFVLADGVNNHKSLVRLNKPAISISDIQTVSAGDGKRRINVQLNNNSYVNLKNNTNKKVTVTLYSDHEKSTAIGASVVLNNMSDSKIDLLDQGAYVASFEVDVAELLGAGVEISPEGQDIYVVATIEDTVIDKVDSSATKVVRIMPLGDGGVRISKSDAYDSETETYTVTLSAINTSMKAQEEQTITISAVNAAGDAIAQKTEKVSFNPEEEKEITVTFTAEDCVVDHIVATSLEELLIQGEWRFERVDEGIKATYINPADDPETVTPASATVSISAKDMKYTGSAYDAYDNLSIIGADEFEELTGRRVAASDMKYYRILTNGATENTTAANSGARANNGAPVKIGSYVVKYEVEGVVLWSQEFEIRIPTLTKVPEANGDFVKVGEDKGLWLAGESGLGTVEYRYRAAGENTWSDWTTGILTGENYSDRTELEVQYGIRIKDRNYSGTEVVTDPDWVVNVLVRFNEVKAEVKENLSVYGDVFTEAKFIESDTLLEAGERQIDAELSEKATEELDLDKVANIAMEVTAKPAAIAEVEDKDFVDAIAESETLNKVMFNEATINPESIKKVYLDIKVNYQLPGEKTVKELHDTAIPVDVVLPLKADRIKDEPIVVRYHETKSGNSVFNVFSKLKEKPEGKLTDATYYIDKETNMLHIYTDKFSDYALIYAEGSKTISFETNGGAPLYDIKVSSGYTCKLPVPTRSGYEFAGWYSDAELTQSVDESISVDDDMTLYADWTKIVVKPSYPIYSSDPSEYINVPLNNEKTVQVVTTIKAGNATVSEIKESDISKITENSTASGKEAAAILIDVSAAKQEVNTVTFTKTTVDTLAKALADDTNKLESLDVKLPQASVSFDAKALAAINEQSRGYTVKISVTDTHNSNLTVAQQNAIKDMKVENVFDVRVESNGIQIHDFKDGEAEVSVALTVPTGKQANHYFVYFVADNGTLEKFSTKVSDGKLSFTTTHFSKYVIVYDETETNDNENNTEEPKVTAPTKAQITKNSLTLNKRLKVSQTDKNLNVAWGKVADADGYLVYAAYCGNDLKKVKTITDVNTTSYKFTKLDGKALNLTKNYKVVVKAYKVIDGKKVEIGKSLTAYVAGSKSTKYTNAKSITITSKTKLSLKVGKTSTIKATTNLVSANKKLLSDGHAKEFRYVSSNTSVATVDANGKIKAKKAGTCTIYVFSRNGYAKTVKVTVK